MIRWMLKWVFKKEYSEALKLLEAAQAIPLRYVKYDTYKLDSLQFLEPMQETIKSTYVKYWLFSRRDEYERLIKYGTAINRDQNIGRAMAIDELLLDLAGFGAKYRELIEEQAKDAKIQS
jgi:hypothetical protein